MVKKSAKSAAEAEPNEDNLESNRLEDLAIDRGVLSRARRVASSIVPPSNLMLKADGKDVTKKSSARRNRYLLVFNCQLAPAAAGKLGTLANLDTKNPAMYLEFPEGRLRLRGTLVFPRNKYVVLKLGQKEVVCEDVMESMIVFSEAQWVGTVAENPNEEALPMPEHLKTEKRHTKADFGTRGGDVLNAASQEMDIEETQDEDAGDAGAMPSQPPSQRRTSRQTAAGKKRRYAEDSDASLDDDDEEKSDREPASKKLPRAPSAAALRKPKAARPASQQQLPAVINLAADTDDSDEEKPFAARSGKQSTLAAFFKKTAVGGAAKKASPAKPNRSSRKTEVIDLATSDSEDSVEEEEDVPASQRPRRAAAGAASKNLKADSDSHEASEDDEGSDGGATSEEEDVEEEACEESEYEEEEDMDDVSEESDG